MNAFVKKVASVALLAATFVPSQALDSSLAQEYPSAVFIETFSKGNSVFDNTAAGRWVKSKDSRYNGDAVSVKKIPFEDEGQGTYEALVLENAATHYGLSGTFDKPLSAIDKEIVVQYEVKASQYLDCGGAYVKVLGKEGAKSLDKLKDSTPYVIMFGPDKCGSTNKVHFIFKHQNPISKEWEEKHLKAGPSAKLDKGKTHLYTLVVRPDQSYEIFINQKSERSGSLLEDFDPPVNPPKQIDDPSDKKPEDWVDEAQIEDPDAKKPDDWDEDQPMYVPDEDAQKPAGWLDNEPLTIPDPAANKPDDWDDEDDGEWEAPEVPNPKCQEAPGCGKWQRPTKKNPLYKGKWTPPLIDNPAYKGEWFPRKIDNPNFFEDLHPSRFPDMHAVAIEIWTMTGGLEFSNFFIGNDLAEAEKFAKTTWVERVEAESRSSPDYLRNQILAFKDRLTGQEGAWPSMQLLGAELALWAVDNKFAAAFATGFILLGTVLLILTLRSTAGPTVPEARAQAAEEEEAEAEEEEEEKEEKEKEGDEDMSAATAEEVDKEDEITAAEGEAEGEGRSLRRRRATAKK